MVQVATIVGCIGSLLFLRKLNAFQFPGHVYRTTQEATTRSSVLGTTSTLYAGLNRLQKKHSPGAELFPEAGSSYVPSGMTKEEWAKIQKKELQEMKGKDLAAWGPRFAKSERPNDDWMVLPNLWTGGFESNKTKKSSERKVPLDANSTNTTSRSKALVPMFAFSFLMVEFLFMFASLFHNKSFMSIITTALFRVKRGVSVSFAVLAREMTIKFLLAAILTKPLQLLIENMKASPRWKSWRTD